MNKEEFKDALDGTEARIREAFLAGFSEGTFFAEANLIHDEEEVYNRWKEINNRKCNP